MIFHLILNSFLVFTILSILVEIFIFIFEIKNARFRYLCRLLPILKFPFDLLIFATLGDSLFLNLNPFSCEFHVQKLLSEILPIKETLNIKNIAIPQYIANYIPSSLLFTIVFTSILFSILIFGRNLTQLIRSQIYLRQILLDSSTCNRTIFNQRLQNELTRSKSVILSSLKVHTPFAAGKRYIFVPSDLAKTFSQEEFEAVIAHELEHLRWKDPLLRFFSSTICAIFWWIPTSWLIKRLREDQEEASDATIYKYLIDPYSLGSALVKTVKNRKRLKLNLHAICPFISSKTCYQKRLNNLLNPHRTLQVKGRAYLGAFLCLVAFFSFWAC